MRHLLTALLCSLSLSLHADANFSGYVKSYAIVQDEIDNDLIQFDQLFRSQTSTRLMLDYFNRNQVWQFHYEVGLETNSHLQRFVAAASPSEQSYRLTDIRPIIGPEDKKNVVLQNLDRFNVQFQLATGDLTIGRQAITFGSARIINPTDVFLPFNVTTFCRRINTHKTKRIFTCWLFS